MRSTDGLIAAALALPEDERARFAHELLRSRDSDTSDDVVAAWTPELEKRLQEVREGRAELVDLDDVDLYVEQRLTALRKQP